MTVKIGILGLGTVAQGIPFLLEQNVDKIKHQLGEDIEIAKVLLRSKSDIEKAKAKGFDYDFVTNISEILADDSIQIVVELIGRIEPAKSYIAEALKAKKHVVTANKDLIALHGAELREIAAENQVALYYEAAVAGGIPILRTIANSLASDKIERILGVVNGTSNFMMTKMVDEGWTYEQALETAQALGYAESDPTNDVDGIDAGFKMMILSDFAFGMSLTSENVHHEGIRTISKTDVELAQKLGYVIKLVGELAEVESGVFAEVTPAFLPETHPLASVNGVMNAVYIDSIGIGQSMYYGPGAGQKPTATSVLADIIRIIKRLQNKTVGKTFNEYQRETKLAQPKDIKNQYYFSIETPDKPGQFLKLTTIFSNQNVSFEQVIQQKSDGKRAVVAIITHQISRIQLQTIKKELALESAFKLLNAFKVLGE